MKILRITKILASIIVIIVLLPAVGYGQISPPEEEISIIVSPGNPGANDLVSLTVISSLSLLQNSLITWTKNGVNEKSGLGETRHQTRVGGLGGVTNITVTVSDNDSSLQKSVSIRPAEVKLIWEADSYTPVFYKGKGLASYQSKVKVVAIPSLINSSGNKLGDGGLIYEWSLDGKLDGKQSGTGKNVFNFKGGIVPRPKRVTLFVRSQDSFISARKSILVNFVEPRILVYKENPLTKMKGVFSMNVGSVKEGESTFVVEPYFFSEEAIDKNLLDYKWIVDGRVFNNLEKSRKIIFGSDVTGKSTVSVEISNPSNILQTIKKIFNVVVSG